MEELKSIVAKNISALRIEAGLTQLELADKLNYSDKAVSKWERGESLPDVYVLKQLSEIFGVSVDYILSDKHESKDKPKIRSSKRVISLVALMGIVTLSVVIFVLIWILGSVQWMIFIYSLPVIFTTALIFNSIWNHGRYNFLYILLILVSIILLLYLQFLSFNPWQLFLIIVPAAAVILLSNRIKKRKKQ